MKLRTVIFVILGLGMGNLTYHYFNGFGFVGAIQITVSQSFALLTAYIVELIDNK